MNAGTSTFLVEHYWPGVTAETFRAAAARVQVEADTMAADGQEIHFLHSTLVLGDQAAYCVFEAGSSRLVEEAYVRAGVRFERVLDALEVDAAERVAARGSAIRTSSGQGEAQ